ncbi:MAG: MBL fold metallo-hydrolase [Meiothermus sp.]|nr:MBL fold metallo-hydrolase [Meiothermus sp.]
MRLKILGTSAGGGLPQWNCGCLNCQRARAGQLPRRSQSSLAFTPDDRHWYLVDAGPEVTQQLQHLPHPLGGSRQVPLEGILLTDAELDHTLGLLQLREGSSWRLYATASVLKIIGDRFPLLGVLQGYARPSVGAVEPSRPLRFGGLTVRFVPLSDHTPRYHHGRRPEPEAVSALVFSGRRTVVYAPCVEALTPELEALFRGADAVLVDGTFFHNDELARLGFSADTARSMGHVPVGGDDGSARWLARLPIPTIRYIHLNNTNPLLDPDSPERAWIKTLGLDLADDGWELEL